MRNNPFSALNGISFRENNSFAINQSKPAASFVDGAGKASFGDVVANMVKDTDKSLTMPDELMNRALTQGDVDIHEVMIANTKADIAINVASQVLTKVIQAYERVQQIQV